MSDNKRLDLTDYTDLCKDDSFILFTDFYKVFDSIEYEFKITQHLFYKMPHRFSIFSVASGLSLNINKCELLALKQCTLSYISNIPVKDSHAFELFSTKNKIVHVY